MVIKIVFFMTIICSTGAKFVGNNVFVPFCQFFAFTPVNLVVQSFFHLESVSKQQSLYQLSYYCPNPLSERVTSVENFGMFLFICCTSENGSQP